MTNKRKCTPCEVNAVLQVGDRICHSLDDGLPCHRLVDEVQSGRMSVDRYLDKLEKKAVERQKKVELAKIKKIKEILQK